MSKLAIALLVASVVTTSYGAEIVIKQKGKKFNPGVINAKIGDTLVFKNDDADVTHNVYSMTADNAIESQMQKPGETLKVVLEPGKHKPGTIDVKCAVHPDMKLKVTVAK